MVNTLKKVLVLLPLAPHSEGDGSQKRAAAHLSALFDAVQLHLVVLDSDTTSGKRGEERLYERCSTVSVVKYDRRPRRPIVNVPPFPTLSELFDPSMSRNLPSPDHVRETFAQAATQEFDTVLCFKLLGAAIFDFAQSVIPITCRRKIVDFDDIQSLANQRSLQYVPSGVEQSIIYALMDWRIRRAEGRCLASYDTVWVCSEMDRGRLLSREPNAQIDVVTNSVPLVEALPPREDRPDIHLLFVGKISYGPNREGILWFCREVMPLIRARSRQKVKLSIVGFNPPSDVQSLEEAGDIVVTGGVESVEPYYRDSDIVIAPIRFGSGTRIKILEAMSHRRPVISTTLGAEGIDVRHGENIMIADTAEAFAACCLEAIENRARRYDIAERGRVLIEDRYSNKTVAETVRRLI